MAQQRRFRLQGGDAPEAVPPSDFPGAPEPSDPDPSPSPDVRRLPAPDMGESGPIDPNINPARGEETSRERAVAPRRPMEPTAMSATSSPSMQTGVLPFQPLPQLGGGRSNLFGSMGGLKGGGLGIPMDPTPDTASDPISTLIQLLMKGR